MSLLTRLFLAPTGVTPDHGRRLRALANDCEHLRPERPVSPTLLQKAPLLQVRAPAMTPAGGPSIRYVTGYPVHSGRAVVTSPDWVADPEGMWVRTLSRFYRLGTPLHRDETHHVVTGMAIPNEGDAGVEDEA